MPKKYAAIILAAGSSSRLGKPKQLIEFKGNTLLQQAIDTAKAAVTGPVIVVTGANREKLLNATAGSGSLIISNEDWEEGIASSIRKGIEALEQSDNKVDGAIVMVCDQPYCDETVLRNLIAEQQRTGKAAVASAYGGSMGTPVLFEKQFFNDLKKLSGDSGAKKLLKAHPDRVATVEFENGDVDIDTPEDLQKLQSTWP